MKQTRAATINSQRIRCSSGIIQGAKYDMVTGVDDNFGKGVWGIGDTVVVFVVFFNNERRRSNGFLRKD
jgi:hypothetical protein